MDISNYSLLPLIGFCLGRLVVFCSCVLRRGKEHLVVRASLSAWPCSLPLPHGKEGCLPESKLQNGGRSARPPRQANHDARVRLRVETPGLCLPGTDKSPLPATHGVGKQHEQSASDSHAEAGPDWPTPKMGKPKTRRVGSPAGLRKTLVWSGEGRRHRVVELVVVECSLEAVVDWAPVSNPASSIATEQCNGSPPHPPKRMQPRCDGQ